MVEMAPATRLHLWQGGQMLILTRRIGETIIIETPEGTLITVTVLGVKGNQVRIGTDAPEKVVILREELLEQLEASP